MRLTSDIYSAFVKSISVTLVKAAGKRVVEAYDSKAEDEKKSLLLSIANTCGPEMSALENAILLYKKNSSMVHEVREAATPVHFRLLQSIGNLPGGIRVICDMRAHLLVANYEAVHPVEGVVDIKKRVGPHRR
ncbi:unnamed protein product [Strongylus vulgaris]|uniref:Malonyl-CoA decarboxylase N-terminal domain-containing protein n=1 Tax=Strongylus vulgaris TaxID=40348 RepID=A0A3P7HX57_STRVU|nr:unnamed protein product [Strongylus vulgaris]